MTNPNLFRSRLQTKYGVMPIGHSIRSSKRNKSELPGLRYLVRSGSLPSRFRQGTNRKPGNGFYERQFPEELLARYSLHLSRFMKGAKKTE